MKNQIDLLIVLPRTIESNMTNRSLLPKRHLMLQQQMSRAPTIRTPQQRLPSITSHRKRHLVLPPELVALLIVIKRLRLVQLIILALPFFDESASDEAWDLRVGDLGRPDIFQVSGAALRLPGQECDVRPVLEFRERGNGGYLFSAAVGCAEFVPADYDAVFGVDDGAEVCFGSLRRGLSTSCHTNV
jgi:hypothetical protein